MKVRSPLILVLVLSFCVLGQLPLPGQAATVGFAERPPNDLAVPSLADRDVTRLVSTLDSMLAVPKPAADWKTDATFTLWQFAGQLQASRLTVTQEAQVLEHLDGVRRTHPDSAPAIDKTRYMLTHLTVGKTAPEISGEDLDGAPFKLSDYRGKIVLLAFTGEWCGICRSQYPYERLLLELYKNWPFAIVSVDSGNSRDDTKRMHADQGLAFRSWWDGGPDKKTNGPIASAWNCTRLADRVPDRSGRRNSFRRPA